MCPPGRSELCQKASCDKVPCPHVWTHLFLEPAKIAIVDASSPGMLQDVKKQTEVMSWLMFQMGGLGPMQGQV